MERGSEKGVEQREQRRTRKDGDLERRGSASPGEECVIAFHYTSATDDK